jgi:hypothetical protein
MSEAETQIEPVAPASKASEELYLGDAIHFFLSAKRAGGRSQRTIDDYRKKLELFQRWVASRYGNERGTEELDAPYLTPPEPLTRCAFTRVPPSGATSPSVRPKSCSPR